MPKLAKLPLYVATQSLDVCYSFNYGEKESAKVQVKGAGNHAILYAGVTNLLEVRKKECNYTKDLSKINIASANFTVLYTDTDTDEGYLGENVEQKTFAIGDLSCSNRIFGVSDYHKDTYKIKGIAGNKAGRDRDFNKRLFARVNSFASIVKKYDIGNGSIDDQEKIKAAVESSMFHENFYHSEQALMHFLSSPTGIDLIIAGAKEAKAVYFYGLVLDIYSQRVCCENCNISLLGMQNNFDHGFLADLSAGLKEEKIEPRLNNKVMLNTRISASRGLRRGANMDPFRLIEDKAVMHEYDPDRNNLVFEADAQSLGVTKIIRDQGLSVSTYNGSFFVSRAFAKVKLEKHIAVPLQHTKSLVQTGC